MKRFAALYEALESSNSTADKVAAMENYFREAPAADAVWALHHLLGAKGRRPVPSAVLKQCAMAIAAVPEWLFDESHAAVGDLAETCALLSDGAPRELSDVALHVWMRDRIAPLAAMDATEQQRSVRALWSELSVHETLVFNKVLLGAFRVGVSRALVIRALAQATDVPPAEMEHRLMGSWAPTEAFFQSLAVPVEGDSTTPSRPYPFCLASPLEGDVEALGDRSEWQVEWKWDGIRAQVIRRGGQVFVWSRGEELVTDRFPEISSAAMSLTDGIVLDGEILVVRDGVVQPFAALQTRIGRQKLSKTTLQQTPVSFFAYDLLEHEGLDIRSLPMRERRARLELVLRSQSTLQLSPCVEDATWSELQARRVESRSRGVEGFMLKSLTSSYGTGRRRGDWWKWKIEPYSVDAVLVYAQAGTGRRAHLFTDYTFGVWDGAELVPIAKAYSGLTDEEIATLDVWIRKNTREKHGPVRIVEPTHVFEIAFESIALSSRHRSGIAVRFPRILRWRHDKPTAQADSLESMKQLLRVHVQTQPSGEAVPNPSSSKQLSLFAME